MCSRTHDNCTTKERSRRKEEGTHSETFKTCNFSLLPLLLLLFSLFYLFSSLFFLFFWLLFGCTRKKDFLIRNAKRDARAKVVAAVAGRQRDQRDVRAEVGWEKMCLCVCVCATYPIFPLLRIYYNYYYFFFFFIVYPLHCGIRRLQTLPLPLSDQRRRQNFSAFEVRKFHAVDKSQKADFSIFSRFLFWGSLHKEINLVFLAFNWLY